MGFIRNGEFRERGEKDNFFRLENDGDIKLVRLLCKSVDDIPVVTYHYEEVDGYSRKISCLRDSYDDPYSKCPLCKAGKTITAKKYFQLLVYATDKNGNPVDGQQPELQIWDRGKKFVDKLKSIQTRLERKGKNICDVFFDIERIGKKGDTSTTYELYERTDLDAGRYPITIPEMYNPIGKSVYDYSFEQLTNYVEGRPIDDEGVEKREPQSADNSRNDEQSSPWESSSNVKEGEQEYRRNSRRL